LGLPEGTNFEIGSTDISVVKDINNPSIPYVPPENPDNTENINKLNDNTFGQKKSASIAIVVGVIIGIVFLVSLGFIYYRNYQKKIIL
jgi:hypothetical protein